MTKTNLDFAVTTFAHLGNKLVNDHPLILREEKLLQRRQASPFYVVETNHLEPRTIHKNGIPSMSHIPMKSVLFSTSVTKF